MSTKERSKSTKQSKSMSKLLQLIGIGQPRLSAPTSTAVGTMTSQTSSPQSPCSLAKPLPKSVTPLPYYFSCNDDVNDRQVNSRARQTTAQQPTGRQLNGSVLVPLSAMPMKSSAAEFPTVELPIVIDESEMKNANQSESLDSQSRRTLAAKDILTTDLVPITKAESCKLSATLPGIKPAIASHGGMPCNQTVYFSDADHQRAQVFKPETSAILPQMSELSEPLTLFAGVTGSIIAGDVRSRRPTENIASPASRSTEITRDDTLDTLTRDGNRLDGFAAILCSPESSRRRKRFLAPTSHKMNGEFALLRRRMKSDSNVSTTSTTEHRTDSMRQFDITGRCTSAMTSYRPAVTCSSREMITERPDVHCCVTNNERCLANAVDRKLKDVAGSTGFSALNCKILRECGPISESAFPVTWSSSAPRPTGRSSIASDIGTFQVSIQLDHLLIVSGRFVCAIFAKCSALYQHTSAVTSYT